MRSMRSRPEARADLGYTLCRIQWMLAQNKIDDAAGMIVAALTPDHSLQEPINGGASGVRLPPQAARSGPVPGRAYDVIRRRRRRQ